MSRNSFEGTYNLTLISENGEKQRLQNVSDKKVLSQHKVWWQDFPVYLPSYWQLHKISKLPACSQKVFTGFDSVEPWLLSWFLLNHGSKRKRLRPVKRSNACRTIRTRKRLVDPIVTTSGLHISVRMATPTAPHSLPSSAVHVILTFAATKGPAV